LKGAGTSDKFLVSKDDDSLRYAVFVVSIEIFSQDLIYFFASI
jgi:hypothetical protein